MENQSLKSLELKLRHHFKDPELLLTALTHRSYYFENRATSTYHFERLEFLGDSILGLIVSEMLMTAQPEAGEGSLSKWRASLVNETTLSEIAASIELGTSIRLGKGENEQRANLRPRLLASAFEAVLAALYLDGGFKAVEVFLHEQFLERVKNLKAENEFAADFKTRLQEFSQKKYRAVPEYRVLGSEGPEHAKIFRCEVLVGGEPMGEGTGNSRKNAEQDAARQALSKLNDQKEEK